MSAILTALLFTTFVEVIVALILGYRKKAELAAVILVNLISNPVLNYFLLLDNRFGLIKVDAWFMLSLEIVVVLVEWQLLAYALQGNPKKLFVLSLAMNFCSFVAGVLIFK